MPQRTDAQPAPFVLPASGIRLAQVVQQCGQQQSQSLLFRKLYRSGQPRCQINRDEQMPPDRMVTVIIGFGVKKGILNRQAEAI